MSLTVVKLGGSFARHSRLDDLIHALESGAGRTVIVPGGGPFADCVRREQKRIGFDDHAAHRMALLAMASYGQMLAGRSTVLKPAASIGAVRQIRSNGGIPVWLPLDLLDGRPDIPESWEMTSDSLAAWLAGELGATRIIFLKRKLPAKARVAELVAAGVVDPLVPRFLASAHSDAWICGHRQIAELAKALAEGGGAGRPLAVA